MRIIHGKSAGVLTEECRAKLSALASQDVENTFLELKSLFPQYVVSGRCGRIQIADRDGILFLDLLNNGSTQTSWLDTAVRLRLTTE